MKKAVSLIFGGFSGDSAPSSTKKDRSIQHSGRAGVPAELKDSVSGRLNREAGGGIRSAAGPSISGWIGGHRIFGKRRL